MKKIIVREKIIPNGYIDSAFIDIWNGKEYNTLNDLLLDYDINDLMMKVYCEEIMDSSLKETELYKSYKVAYDSGKDNELFKNMYQVDDEFAVHITNNIYIYHIATRKDKIYSSIVPWYYVDSKKYIGDTWWEKDEDIIESLKNLSIIEFLKKYKGY